MEEVDLYSLMRPKKVCVCCQVSEAEIIQCIRDGARTVSDISRMTDAGTNCGTCLSSVQKILKRELEKGGQSP